METDIKAQLESQAAQIESLQKQVEASTAFDSSPIQFVFLILTFVMAFSQNLGFAVLAYAIYLAEFPPPDQRTTSGYFKYAAKIFAYFIGLNMITLFCIILIEYSR